MTEDDDVVSRALWTGEDHFELAATSDRIYMGEVVGEDLFPVSDENGHAGDYRSVELLLSRGNGSTAAATERYL